MQYKKSAIAIIDYGSQYTLLILKKLNLNGFISVIFPSSVERLPDTYQWKGIILSGGPESASSQVLAKNIEELILQKEIPILGICYGLQLIIKFFGGEIQANSKSEFGCSELKIISTNHKDDLFKKDFFTGEVWMSHNDSVTKIPKDFIPIAYSSSGALAACKHKTKKIYAVQFHPEVTQTKCGSIFLNRFASNICQLKNRKNTKNFINETLCEIKQEVKEGKVLIAVSGGVDSSVTAVLLSKILKSENIFAVLIDHGFMREKEIQEVKSDLLEAGVHIEVIDASKKFLEKLGNESDPESKRKIIGKTFVECFEKFAKHCKGITHLVQGTLYPDVIESSCVGNGAKIIKSHHNVGGLPEKLSLKLLEPLKLCFKNEVREIGLQLGLSPKLIKRHPFPGPGLSVRIPGKITQKKIDILRAADYIFINSLRQEELYDKCWQAGVVLLPVKSVGVMGDNRTYEYACSLRAVITEDAMTAEAVDLPMSFLRKVSSNIINSVDGINRVLYDVTSKPPATIEWE